MKIKEFIDYLEELAPVNLQESYDNCGLLTGNPHWEAKGVLTTLDCTEEVIDEALSKNCNLIIAHHPIIFGGLKRLIGKNYIEKTIIKAIKHDVAIYAAHTNFDNVLSNGINQKLASILGLTNIKILNPKNDLLNKIIVFCPQSHVEQVRNSLFQAGMGKIGNYDSCSFNTEGTGTFRALQGANPFVGNLNKLHHEPEVKIEGVFESFNKNKILKALYSSHPYEEIAFDIFEIKNTHKLFGSGVIGELTNEHSVEEFLSLVKEKFGLKMLKYTPVIHNKIKTVAVCGGSGSFLIKTALKAGANAYITSDIKYHDFFDTEKLLLLADIGHYESEKHTKELFFELLSKKFTNFALHLSETNTNPVNYF